MPRQQRRPLPQLRRSHRKLPQRLQPWMQGQPVRGRVLERSMPPPTRRRNPMAIPVNRRTSGKPKIFCNFVVLRGHAPPPMALRRDLLPSSLFGLWHASWTRHLKSNRAIHVGHVIRSLAAMAPQSPSTRPSVISKSSNSSCASAICRPITFTRLSVVV